MAAVFEPLPNAPGLLGTERAGGRAEGQGEKLLKSPIRFGNNAAPLNSSGAEPERNDGGITFDDLIPELWWGPPWVDVWDRLEKAEEAPRLNLAQLSVGDRKKRFGIAEVPQCQAVRLHRVARPRGKSQPAAGTVEGQKHTVLSASLPPAEASSKQLGEDEDSGEQEPSGA